MSRRTVGLALAFACGLLLVEGDAWARIGGGEGYGRGGSSGGGGGGGGDEIPIELIFLLIRLCIQYPAVGIPLVMVITAFVVLRSLAGGLGGRQVHRTRHHPAAAPPRARVAPVPGLAELRQQDPAFSLPVLQDYLILLHRRAHEAIGTSTWEPLAPFVAETGRDQLRAAHPEVTSVTEIVVGAVRIRRVAHRAEHHVLEAQFEATQLEKLASGRERRMLVTETWSLRRAIGARSLAPEKVERLGCPNCGAAFETTKMGACPTCETPITAGQLQWQLVGVKLDSRVQIPSPKLAVSPGGEESSVHHPTVTAPDLAARLRELVARHPDFEVGAFNRRVRDVYLELQSAWSEGRWEAIRPWVTDPLFQSLRFWIERFTRSGLRNRLTEVELRRAEIVRVEVDAWYESITVRIFGAMKDFVVDADGRVVGGNDRQTRVFSEYWTFLRAAGTGGAVHDAHACPSCGGPLDKVSQAGVCGYCGSKITTGRFDWVLSRIEQPEAYE